MICHMARAFRWLPIVLGWMLAGCFFDRTGLDVDGGRDAGPPDTGPPDVGPPDTGPPSCNTQYGSAAGYELCEERPTECEFLSLLEGMRSCRTTCEALGGRCIRAYSDLGCVRQGDPFGCDEFHGDDICICSRGP
jgi:hypothetical protein